MKTRVTIPYTLGGHCHFSEATLLSGFKTTLKMMEKDALPVTLPLGK